MLFQLQGKKADTLPTRSHVLVEGEPQIFQYQDEEGKTRSSFSIKQRT